jgi:hypothetical protein
MGNIIKTKNVSVASLPFLHRLVLKRIFNKKGMTREEEYLIEYSMGRLGPQRCLLHQRRKKSFNL